MDVVLADGAMDGGILTEIPDNTRILYCTFTNEQHTIRWSAWTSDQSPDVIPALEVDNGEYVYAYRVRDYEPMVQYLDEDTQQVGTAALFNYWAKSMPTKEPADES